MYEIAFFVARPHAAVHHTGFHTALIRASEGNNVSLTATLSIKHDEKSNFYFQLRREKANEKLS